MRSLFPLADKGGERLLSIGFFRLVPSVSLFLIVVQIGLISWRIVPAIYGQTAVPLHYNIHFGVDTIGDWWRIYTVPTLALCILLINMGLAQFFFVRDRALAYMAGGATLVLEAILFVASLFIILLNLSYG